MNFPKYNIKPRSIIDISIFFNQFQLMWSLLSGNILILLYLLHFSLDVTCIASLQYIPKSPPVTIYKHWFQNNSNMASLIGNPFTHYIVTFTKHNMGRLILSELAENRLSAWGCMQYLCILKGRLFITITFNILTSLFFII